MSTYPLKDSIQNETQLKFETATIDELDDIVKFYHEAIKTPGCTWNDEYPSYQTAKEDLILGGLYILRLNGSIIGAVSIVPKNELDHLDCFTVKHSAREFARITVLSSFCNKGYAKKMLNSLTDIAKNSGVKAWHILVAIDNLLAITLYKAFGFSFLNECEMYGNRYYICEKIV